MPYSPISTTHLVPIGMALLVLIALPGLVGFVYCLTKTPKEIAAAFGASSKFMQSQRLRRGYALLFAVFGFGFGSVAVLFVAAGLGSALAQHLLSLA